MIALPAALGLSAALLSAMPAAAAGAAGAATTGPSEVLFLVQVIVLLVVGRLLGEAMQRIGQPAVMGQLLAGILLGPSVLGALWPEAQHALFPSNRDQKAMIDAVSQLGILMLLLLTGMETDLALVRKVRRAAASVSVTGIAVPFALGFLVGELLPDSILPRPDLRLVTSLFLGTSLSISSVKIVAMVVREMHFMRRNVGQVIVASAIIDDTIGWIIIAITFGIALHGRVELWPLAASVVGTVLFLAASFTFGRRLVFVLIRWTNDNFVTEAPVLTAILVVMGVMALITNLIGVHTVLGAFVAGILVGQSPILSGHIEERLRGLIVALFMPVFFGLAGLSADLTILKSFDLLALSLALIAIASVGKFAGAFLGGKIGGLSRAESFALACGMNARGSTEVIVASIGLSMGALNESLYTMIVAMAVVTTMAMPPMLRWALARLPMSEEERLRLEREAFEAQGFVPNLERLLVAADDSAGGRFASRLAGLVAGSRGLPTTVLQLAGADAAPEPPEGAPSVRAAVTAAAEATANAQTAEPTEEGPAEVDVLPVRAAAPTEEAVTVEASKGYDLLFVGLEPALAPDGALSDEITRAAAGAPGPLAIVLARGAHRAHPVEAGLDILVPVTGTEVSRRAAELALALAKASGKGVTALAVASTLPGRGRRRDGSARAHRRALIEDVRALADRYEVPIRVVVRADIAPGDAILREAGRNPHTLVVMGVSRRPGRTLFFGEVAETVLDRSGASILLLSA